MTNQFTGIQETWLILQMPAKEIFEIWRLFKHLMDNLISTLDSFFSSFLLRYSLHVPVETHLTNSLEGIPYIIGCWEERKKERGKILKKGATLSQ